MDMDQDKKIELYLKGYEEGQKEAWSKIKSMISRFEGWELKSRIESKLGTLYQEIESKRVDLKEDPSPLSLEKDIIKEPESEEKKDVTLNIGESILVIEENSYQGIKKFLEINNQNRNGLFISREAPDKIIKKFDFINHIEFVWLSKDSRKKYTYSGYDINTISPSNLSKLSTKVGTFLKHNENGVIFLSGIPSLINFSDFKKVQKFIGWTLDTVTQRDGNLIVSVSPNSIKKKRLGILKDEFDRIS